MQQAETPDNERQLSRSQCHSGDDPKMEVPLPPMLPSPARLPPEMEVIDFQPDSADPKAECDETPHSLPIDSHAEPLPASVSREGLRVLFLSSDTGGGHRASAESLARQFELLYPGSTYELLDVVSEHGVQPYSSLVSWYSHLSSHPAQWKLVYGVSNSRAFEMMADVHLKVMCERATRKRILSYDPDVVVSVHPLMCNVPALACHKIEKKTGRHLPMYTVVTDLGSAHCLWFANKVDKVYVASDAVAQLARQRGKVPDDKLVKIGLPIRHDFAVQAGSLGDRTSDAGRAYQASVRRDLGLSHADRRTILCMGGGEGVGSLSVMVNHLYVELVARGIDAQILVVCGRNEKLRADLAERDWSLVLASHARIRDNGAKLIGNLAFDFGEMRQYCSGAGGGTFGGGGIFPGSPAVGCIQGKVTNHLRRILSASALENAVTTPLPASSGDSLAGTVESAASPLPTQVTTETRGTNDDGEEADMNANDDANKNAWKEAAEEMAANEEDDLPSLPSDAAPDSAKDRFAVDIDPVAGDVIVHPLGFVKRMAEYMVAADLLITKAGPGTIAEAASLSLPVLLTSFLPGQEEGNVDFVVENGFGAFRPDSHPAGVAELAADWLLDEEQWTILSRRAGECGVPHAAREIVSSIGEDTLQWREVNAKRAKEASIEKEKKAAGKNEGEGKEGYIMRTFRTISSVSSTVAD